MTMLSLVRFFQQLEGCKHVEKSDIGLWILSDCDLGCHTLSEDEIVLLK